ncbi:MAG: ROK family protein [Chloroflexi bacterium]|nr:MAG: ROK family protein [Chloroflexota bacterium]
MALFGGIEAGGTKFVCAVGTAPDDIRAEIRFPTTTPEETIGRAIAFFQEQQAIYGTVQAVGIGSFGPVDPHPDSPTYGYITTTPKPGWANTPFAGWIKEALGVPVAFDTDVNVAALGEGMWGAAQGLDTFLYLTVGTGIGGGAMVNGRLLHGLLHPEMGHILLPRDPQKDPYNGRCPYHGDCLEGLASGPAIAERWQKPGTELPPEHPAWELEAHYLATALVNFICTLSPQRIILGGGVMSAPGLLPRIRQKTTAYLNQYIQSPAITKHTDTYITAPALGNKSGVLGAIALAKQHTQ